MIDGQKMCGFRAAALRWIASVAGIIKVLDLLERSIYRLPQREISMDIILPAKNGDRVGYRLVGQPAQPNIGAD
ncbi:hypothetical protein, partial [Mesorhizobium sp.]|uniref:hypothetical protein n=1 Tax=Mesorhizobium sp. TaxID=1871066 RepID=UPI0025C47C48